MNAPEQIPSQDEITAKMTAVLDAQRQDYLKEGVVTAETRIDRLERGIDAVFKHQKNIIDALNSDFSCRSRQVTLLTDVAASIGPMKHAKKHLRKWMKGEKRPTMFPLNLMGGRSRIQY